ncbi:MAG TPA: hypothetical protein IAB39_06130 [Candidatus Onthovicinus excrementipullorum]|nr:hypothetical protein [Candidatus Onthovicinus excrementipullorum]
MHKVNWSTVKKRLPDASDVLSESGYSNFFSAGVICHLRAQALQLLFHLLHLHLGLSLIDFSLPPPHEFEAPAKRSEADLAFKWL